MKKSIIAFLVISFFVINCFSKSVTSGSVEIRNFNSVFEYMRNYSSLLDLVTSLKPILSKKDYRFLLTNTKESATQNYIIKNVSNGQWTIAMGTRRLSIKVKSNHLWLDGKKINTNFQNSISFIVKSITRQISGDRTASLIRFVIPEAHGGFFGSGLLKIAAIFLGATILKPIYKVISKTVKFSDCYSNLKSSHLKKCEELRGKVSSQHIFSDINNLRARIGYKPYCDVQDDHWETPLRNHNKLSRKVKNCADDLTKEAVNVKLRKQAIENLGICNNLLENLRESCSKGEEAIEELRSQPHNKKIIDLGSLLNFGSSHPAYLGRKSSWTGSLKTGTFCSYRSQDEYFYNQRVVELDNLCACDDKLRWMASPSVFGRSKNDCTIPWESEDIKDQEVDS